MRQDGGALGNGRGKSACMVEVRVRIDDKPDWLVRNRLLRRRHHRHPSRVALPAFDDEHVIAHVDGQGAV